LHNPILAENLDRWARVYAAAPPEFRSQAIQDLLRDLQAGNASRMPAREGFQPSSSFHPVEIACPQCGKIKEPQQKFCGFCGAEFQSRPRPESRVMDSALAPPSTADPLPPLKPVQSVPFASRELDSLRELSFSTIYGAEEPPHNGAKYAFVMLVVLACLGTLGFMQWRTQIRAAWNRLVAPSAVSAPAQANNAPAASSAPSAAQPTSASPSEAAPANAGQHPQSASSDAQQQGIAPAVDAAPPASSTPASPEPGSGQANTDQAASGKTNSQRTNSDQSLSRAKRAPENPVTPAAKLESVKETPSPAPIDNGSEELSVAQRYLSGASGTRDPSMAATWLWKAVSKQNPTALVLLSDLYAHGEGVSRNCDQARLLLVAAAKKGAPDAGMKLRNFENRGCQ